MAWVGLGWVQCNTIEQFNVNNIQVTQNAAVAIRVNAHCKCSTMHNKRFDSVILHITTKAHITEMDMGPICWIKPTFSTTQFSPTQHFLNKADLTQPHPSKQNRFSATLSNSFMLIISRSHKMHINFVTQRSETNRQKCYKRHIRTTELLYNKLSYVIC